MSEIETELLAKVKAHEKDLNDLDPLLKEIVALVGKLTQNQRGMIAELGKLVENQGICLETLKRQEGVIQALFEGYQVFTKATRFVVGHLKSQIEAQKKPTKRKAPTRTNRRTKHK